METVSGAESVDELLDSFVSASDDALVALLRHHELQRRELEAKMALAAAVLEQRGRFPDGHRSLKTLLRANLNLAGRTAHRDRQIARLLGRFGDIAQAWLSGEVGYDQVAELAKVWHHPRAKFCFASFAPQLLEAAVRFDYDAFLLVIERFMLGADPDGAHDDRDAAIEGRAAHLVINGGAVDAAIVGGDPLVAQEMKAIFDRYVDAEFRADLAARRAEWGDDADGKPLPRCARQRRFDAFVSMIRAAGRDAGTGVAPDVGDRPIAEYCVNIVIDEHRFNELLAERGLIDPPSIDDALNADPRLGGNLIGGLDIAPRCETEDGHPLHPHDVLRAALSGHVRRVVVDSQSVVIDMGRRQRLFTGSARTAAKLLATQCSHPGCDLPADWCEVDHNRPWADDGLTNPRNAALPCRPHHRTKERLGLRYVRDTYGHQRTQRPDGTFILPVGMPPPDFPEGRPPPG